MENNNDNGSYLGVGGFNYRPGGAQLLNYNHFHGALRHLTINTLRLGQNLPTDAEISVHTTHFRMGSTV